MSDQTAPSQPRVQSSPRCQRCSGATVVQRITASRPGHEHWTLRCAATSVKCKLYPARRNPNRSIGLIAIYTHQNEARRMLIERVAQCWTIEPTEVRTKHLNSETEQFNAGRSDDA